MSDGAGTDERTAAADDGTTDTATGDGTAGGGDGTAGRYDVVAFPADPGATRGSRPDGLREYAVEVAAGLLQVGVGILGLEGVLPGAVAYLLAGLWAALAAELYRRGDERDAWDPDDPAQRERVAAYFAGNGPAVRRKAIRNARVGPRATVGWIAVGGVTAWIALALGGPLPAVLTALAALAALLASRRAHRPRAPKVLASDVPRGTVRDLGAGWEEAADLRTTGTDGDPHRQSGEVGDDSRAEPAEERATGP